MSAIRVLAATFAMGAAACATAHHGTRPDDMTAAEHQAASGEHGEQVVGSGYHHPTWSYSSGWYPWYYWSPDDEHRELAQAHRDSAEQLKLQYEAACANLPRGADVSSPLDTSVGSVSPIEGGIAFHLAETAGPPDRVLAQLRCHRAWLKLAPTPGAAEDPLQVDGVTWLTRAGRGEIEVRATASAESARAELARRAAIVSERARGATTAR